MTSFAFGAATDTGRVRRSNQDQFLVTPPVFVVADGMGGHSGGEIAAEIAVETMARATHLASIDELIDLVQDANAEIVTRAKHDPALRGMGTTVCALVELSTAGPHRIGVANVGDSRLYRRTDSSLHRHTEDHSLVEALVRDGRLSRAEAATHPQRNIVTRALGIDEKVLVDAWELAPVAGDRYLLCSDGLFGEIAESEILEVLTDAESPQIAADDLVERACAAGGRDNVTVVVVDVVEADSFDDPPPDRVTDSRKALPDRILDADRNAAAQGADGSDSPDTDRVPIGAPPSIFTWRLVAFVAGVVLVLGVFLASITIYARSTYYVGLDGESVVIYKGRPGGVLWFDPTIETDVEINVGQLDEVDLPAVSEGIEFGTLGEAKTYADQLMERAGLSLP